MVKAERGSVINIGSSWSSRASVFNQDGGGVDYCSSKAALQSLTRAAAQLTATCCSASLRAVAFLPRPKCPVKDVLIRIQRGAPRRKRADGQQEVGALRRIAGAGGELRGALRRDKAGVAALPSFELAIEEAAPRRVVGERRQVRIHAGDEAAGAI